MKIQGEGGGWDPDLALRVRGVAERVARDHPCERFRGVEGSIAHSKDGRVAFVGGEGGDGASFGAVGGGEGGEREEGAFIRAQIICRVFPILCIGLFIECVLKSCVWMGRYA